MILDFLSGVHMQTQTDEKKRKIEPSQLLFWTSRCLQLNCWCFTGCGSQVCHCLHSKDSHCSHQVQETQDLALSKPGESKHWWVDLEKTGRAKKNIGKRKNVIPLQDLEGSDLNQTNNRRWNSAYHKKLILKLGLTHFPVQVARSSAENR